jgi:hypothetical protein
MIQTTLFGLPRVQVAVPGPFACAFCEKTFQQSGHRANHMSIVHTLDAGLAKKALREAVFSLRTLDLMMAARLIAPAPLESDANVDDAVGNDEVDEQLELLDRVAEEQQLEAPEPEVSTASLLQFVVCFSPFSFDRYS